MPSAKILRVFAFCVAAAIEAEGKATMAFAPAWNMIADDLYGVDCLSQMELESVKYVDMTASLVALKALQDPFKDDKYKNATQEEKQALAGKQALWKEQADMVSPHSRQCQETSHQICVTVLATECHDLLACCLLVTNVSCNCLFPKICWQADSLANCATDLAGQTHLQYS